MWNPFFPFVRDCMLALNRRPRQTKVHSPSDYKPSAIERPDGTLVRWVFGVSLPGVCMRREGAVTAPQNRSLWRRESNGRRLYSLTNKLEALTHCLNKAMGEDTTLKQ